MTHEQDFLIRKGIHHFVNYQEQKCSPVFSISKTAHPKMARHAQMLIRGDFGEATQIRFE
jgi:hypothetical protein